MDTPYLPKSLFAKDFEQVYEPAEDTFLLLDALENDLDNLKMQVQVCLEVGSGSGTVITALSKVLNKPSHRVLMIATDINRQACLTTLKSVSYHHQKNVHMIQTNLADSLVDRLRNDVDLLVFNPPYVPTDGLDSEVCRDNKINLSWAGGIQGRQIIDEFMKFVPILLKKPSGTAYLVAIESNNINELVDYLKHDYNIEGKVVISRQAGMELLKVIRYTWIV